jgi:hypothetical protein
MSLVRLRKDRASSVALLFAIMAIAVIGLVGAAVDYGFWNQTVASLSLAANGAALNAVKVAAAGELANDSAYLTEGTTAGTNWFEGQINSNAAHFTNPVPTVSVSGTTTVTATVSFSSEVTSIFGRWFGIKQYPISVTATAVIQNAPYLEVVLMLDNSSSMDIGATTADMQTLMNKSGCDQSNVYYENSAGAYVNDNEDQYGVYQYQSTYGNYDGTLTYPIVDGSVTMTPAKNTGIATCDPANVTSGACTVAEQCPQTINKNPTYAGPPCAFACHWDGTKQAGLGTDLWAAARKEGVTLRLDLVKNATNTVLQAMQSYNVGSLNNLSVAVYTFNSQLNPIYPAPGCTPQTFGCEAGNDFATAMTDVGSPPTPGSGVYTDTGIQPVVGQLQDVGNNYDTAVTESMTDLATNYVTPAGNGTSPTSPRKVLFLITDGFMDDPNLYGSGSARAAMPASTCTQFKNLGFTVYVVYTPYYPLMHIAYLQNWISMVEGTGTNSITYNLQQCSSYTNAQNLNTYFIEATNQTQLNQALSGFLLTALQQAAKFTH